METIAFILLITIVVYGLSLFGWLDSIIATFALDTEQLEHDLVMADLSREVTEEDYNVLMTSFVSLLHKDHVGVIDFTALQDRVVKSQARGYLRV